MEPDRRVDHLRQHRMGAGIGAVEIGRRCPAAQPAGSVARERRMARDAGIVDEDVDVAEAGEGGLHRIGRSAMSATAAFTVMPSLPSVSTSASHLVAAVERGDRRALRAEEAAEPLADAAGRAGDGDGLACELPRSCRRLAWRRRSRRGWRGADGPNCRRRVRRRRPRAAPRRRRGTRPWSRDRDATGRRMPRSLPVPLSRRRMSNRSAFTRIGARLVEAGLDDARRSRPARAGRCPRTRRRRSAAPPRG